jgi:hypothetical protein
MVPTGINTWTHQRPHLSDRERAEELAHWRAQAGAPEFRERLWRLVAQSLAAQSVAHQLDAARMRADYGKLEAALNRSRYWMLRRAAGRLVRRMSAGRT